MQGCFLFHLAGRFPRFVKFPSGVCPAARDCYVFREAVVAGIAVGVEVAFVAFEEFLQVGTVDLVGWYSKRTTGYDGVGRRGFYDGYYAPKRPPFRRS